MAGQHEGPAPGSHTTGLWALRLAWWAFLPRLEGRSALQPSVLRATIWPPVDVC